MTDSPRIAIVGVGCRFPEANDLEHFWDDLILPGRTAFKDVPKDRWNHDPLYSPNSRDVDKAWVKKGSFLDGWKDFAAMHYGIAPRRLEVMDPQQRLLIEATRWAIQDAGYETRSFDKRRTGAFFGVSVSEFKNVAGSRIYAMQMANGDFGAAAGTQALRDAMMEMASNVAPMRAFTLAGSLLNMSAASVAQTFDLGGPAYTIDAACASASVAIHDAIMMLRTGAIDVGVAGGVYLNLSPDNLVAFTKIGAISPTGACRPFDEKADGFVQSDGVAVFYLKRLEDALADGDRIHAVILGSGCNNDGRGEGPMTPRVEGQLSVLEQAYRDAGVSPKSIAYFEAHGTATSIGDPAEVTALGRFLTEAGVEAPAEIGSVKGNIGHAMSAAGVAGLAKAVAILQRRVVPPQAGFSRPNPKLGLEKWPLHVAKEAGSLAARPDVPLRVAVSSFGFGGTNSHLILEEPPGADRGEAVSRVVELDLSEPKARPEAVLVTAPTEALLTTAFTNLAGAVEAAAGRISLADVAYTLNARRRRERYRAVIGARTAKELVENLRRAAEGHRTPDIQIFDTGEEARAKRLAFLFPGQGAQKVGLLGDLFERFAAFRERFETLEAAVAEVLERPLSSYLFGDGATEEALAATEVCQPAMAALSLALLDLLQRANVTPSVSLGHSLGEFTALAAGGALDEAAVVKLVAERGKLMQGLGLADPGAMAAVMADRQTVQAAIEGIDGVVVANVNHPKQVSISGTTDGIERAIEVLGARQIEAKRLVVSHAFHSPLLEGVRPGMAALVSGIEIAEPAHTIASCIADHPHASVEDIRETMLAHAAAPVHFVRGLEQARAAGAEIFVQVGAGAMLTSFARATLGRDVPVVSLSGLEADGGYGLIRGLCTLAALGTEVDFEPLYGGEHRQVATLPETPLERQPYWIVKPNAQPKPELTGPFPDDHRKVSLDRGTAASLEEETEAVEAEIRAAMAEPAEGGLVELFHRHTAILEQHAKILAAQTAALSKGAPMEPRAPSQIDEPKAAAPEPTIPAAPPPPPGPPPAAPTARPAPAEGKSVRERVLDVVARVSAFPRQSIRGDQTLVNELGFDSLMVADLGDALARAFPELGAVPASMFGMETTVDDLARELTGALSQPPVEEPEEATPPRPVSRYRVAAHPRARYAVGTSEVTGETWLVTEDDSPLSEAISRALERRGAKLVRVRFVDNGVAAPAKISAGTVNVWPAAYAEGLVGALEETRIDGLIHAAGLGVSNAADFLNPVVLLHPLVAKLSVPRLCVVTALGGRLGLEPNPELSKNVLQAALTGYVKALSRERTGSRIKAIDVDPRRPAEQLGEQVVDELLSGDGTVEVGLGDDRVVARLVPDDRTGPPRRINTDDVVMITGGAGEIGRVVARHLAKKKPKAILLLGRKKENDDIRALLADLSTDTRAFYAAADVTDAGGLITATKAIADKVGPPTIGIHAAGIIEDAPASKKTLESVHRVMNVKVRGLQALLRAFPKLRDLVLFTSWAGRFGNAGQVDYSAANALLDHVAVAGVGSVRVMAVAWPPWASTAMVASIPAPVKKAMLAEGVTFLEDEEGLAAFEALFESGLGGIRVIGRDLPAWETRARLSISFDEESHPYLEDHRLKGRPVVPLAAAADLMAWAFAQTADSSGALVLENLQLARGLFGGDRGQVEVVGKKLDAKDVATVQIKTDGVAYRAKLSTVPDVSAEGFGVSGDKEPLELSLETFYAEKTFHGPRLRGVEKVRKMTPTGIEGMVRPSSIRSWMPGTDRTSWTIDPLVLDGSFQLAAYWLAAHHGRVGFPIGFDRLTVFRPFSDRPTVCRLRVREVSAETFSGDIFYTDDLGTPFALLENVRGRFADVQEEAPGDVDIPKESWDIAAFPEVEQLDQRFQMAELIGLRNPYFHVHGGTAKDTSVVDGVEMVNFSSYNYLGYSGHPEVVAAAQEAIERYGTSVSASRVASGERPLHRELEIGLAKHVGVDDAIVYVSGHATNVTTIGHLFDKSDLIVHDSLIHDSILQGIYLSGATRRPYPHGDLDALEEILGSIRKSYRRVLLCAEGIYSMDGDVCDLPRLIRLKRRYKTLLLVDEAHSIGVLGPAGRGVAHHYDGVDPNDVDLWMGTLSKSFASCGGYIAGSAALVRYLKYTAPGFVYSAGITPPNAAAALKSLELMHREPETVERLRARSRYFLEGAKKRGIDTGLAMGAAVVPAIVGNSMECMRLSQALAGRKINVQPIVYPAVEDDAARLRFFLSALHSEAQLDQALDAVVEELAKIRSAGDAPSLNV